MQNKTSVRNEKKPRGKDITNISGLIATEKEKRPTEAIFFLNRRKSQT